ncbi:helix-turn-helix domain-containing protein [Parachitinimonas caeni]|uniref:Helix-turn-helix domain-containing protein n=1 Tax=Parachitinimonas caeni TaxID=3031301 RepID=A0ABT7DVJ8_9NEIS|nr:helix-turn-helix domain-containing protein [Parachitinimonas caeni]MDK2122667.1 helix-turn-helix domain-containing protein [Parachitinimonas caeni]
MGRYEEKYAAPVSSQEALALQVDNAAKAYLKPGQGAASWLAERLGHQPSRSSLSRMLSKQTPVTLELLDRIAAACKLPAADAINPARVGRQIETGILLCNGRAYSCRFALGGKLDALNVAQGDLIARWHEGRWFVGTRNLPTLGVGYAVTSLLETSARPLPTRQQAVRLFSLNEDWLASIAATLGACGYVVSSHTKHDDLIAAAGSGLDAIVIEGSPFISKAAEIFVKRVRMRVRSHVPVVYAALEHSTLGEFGRVLPGGNNEYAVDLCPDAIQTMLSQLLAVASASESSPIPSLMEITAK